AVTFAARVCPNASARGTSATGSGLIKCKIRARCSSWVVMIDSFRWGCSTTLGFHHQDTPRRRARLPTTVGRHEPNADLSDITSPHDAPQPGSNWVIDQMVHAPFQTGLAVLTLLRHGVHQQ